MATIRSPPVFLNPYKLKRTSSQRFRYKHQPGIDGQTRPQAQPQPRVHVHHTPKVTTSKGRANLKGRVNGTRMITVRGLRYQMDANRTSLKLVISSSSSTSTPRTGLSPKTSRVDSRGSTYLQRKAGFVVKSGANQARERCSRAVKSSITRLRLNNKLRLNKQKTDKKTYCMFFCRFGRCNKGLVCPFTHDPEKVAVCTRFIRGTCKATDCPFSHQIAPEKMPVCYFFLEGRCRNDSCPYRHVNVNPEAKSCRAFQVGYCAKGNACKRLHINACVQFLKTGQCSKGKACLFLHSPPREGHKKPNQEPSKTSKASKTKPTPRQKAENLRPKKSVPVYDKVESENSQSLPEFLPLSSSALEQYNGSFEMNGLNTDTDLGADPFLSRMQNRPDYDSDDTWSDGSLDGSLPKGPPIRILPNFLFKS
jgi:hypothetical protein